MNRLKPMDTGPGSNTTLRVVKSSGKTNTSFAHRIARHQTRHRRIQLDAHVWRAHVIGPAAGAARPPAISIAQFNAGTLHRLFQPIGHAVAVEPPVLTE